MVVFALALKNNNSNTKPDIAVVGLKVETLDLVCIHYLIFKDTFCI